VSRVKRAPPSLDFLFEASLPPTLVMDLDTQATAGQKDDKIKVEVDRFAVDFHRAKERLNELRRFCDAKGLDAFEILARATAHNWAYDRDVARHRNKGVETRQAKAQKRHTNIEKKLGKVGGRVKSVVLIEQQRKRKIKGHSERTVRRVKKSSNRA
jgi:hypothetical protein